MRSYETKPIPEMTSTDFRAMAVHYGEQAKDLQEGTAPPDLIHVLAEWTQRLASALCEAVARGEAAEQITFPILPSAARTPVVRAAVLAERARWCAALFIPPGSPVGTDEEIRMAIEPPSVVAGIVRDAKSAELERCAKAVDDLSAEIERKGYEVDNLPGVLAGCAWSADAIRASGEVRPPTVVGTTRDGRPVTR